MSWTTPKTWNYKEYPSSSDFNTYIRDNMNALRDGSGWSTSAITLGYAEVTSPQASITTGSDLTSLTITVTVPSGGRRLIVRGVANFYSSVANDTLGFRIYEGATILQISYLHLTGNAGNCIVEYSTVPTAGSHTYKLNAFRDTGSGSITMYAGATFPAFIIAKLI